MYDEALTGLYHLRLKQYPMVKITCVSEPKILQELIKMFTHK